MRAVVGSLLILLALASGCTDPAQPDPARPDPARPDPATRAGACEILLGKDDLVGATLRVEDRPDAVVGPAAGLQDKLMTVVYARTPGLWTAAGQLVDYLDDPAGYHEHGHLIPKVSRAAARIHAVCGR